MKNKKTIATFLENSVVLITDFFSYRKKIFLLILLLSTLVLASSFRLYHLEQTPPGVSENEAHLGLLAIDLSDKIITESFFFGDSAFTIFSSLTLLSFKVFGINVFGLRVLSSFIGILTIFGFFLLLRKLHFSFALSLLGTFFLSFSFWHINLSRLACIEIFIPFFTVWFLFFLLSGVFSEKYYHFFTAGAILGLGILLYPLMIFSLLTTILFIFFITILDRKLLGNLKIHLSIFALSILIFSLPLLFQFKNNPTVFLANFEQALNFDTSNLSVTKNVWSYFTSLFYLGDSNQLYNQLSLPAIPLAWSILFLFGFFLSAKNIFSSIYGKSKEFSIPKNIHASILAQCILFLALLIGSLNSSQNPDFKQFSWAIPAIFIFCIIPFEYLLEVHQKLKLSTRISMKKWRWNIMQLSMLILFLAIILAGFSQIYSYFQIWAKSSKTQQSFQHSQVEFGKMIKSLSLKERNFIIVPEDTLLLENGQAENLKILEFAGFPEIKRFVFMHPDESLLQISCDNSLIVFYNSNDLLRKEFQKKCPENNFRKKISPNGTEDFWTMQE